MLLARPVIAVQRLTLAGRCGSYPECNTQSYKALFDATLW
jgi:hypothetical protein